MGLREVEEIDLDLLLFGDPDSDTSESEEIICQCGHGRGRNVVRTVPRLPQAAILHRISLMELRDNDSAISSTGSRRGRGRARILRDHATASAASLPTVGRSKMKADTTESVCRREPECLPQKPESLPQKPQKKYGINWRDDEFPTLTAEEKQSLTEINKSTITDHLNCTDHVIDWEDSHILDREGNTRTRQIKEAIHIGLHLSVMNRDEGAYSLWDLQSSFRHDDGKWWKFLKKTEDVRRRKVLRKTTAASQNCQANQNSVTDPSKTWRTGRRKPHFKEIREKIAILKPEVKCDSSVSEEYDKVVEPISNADHDRNEDKDWTYETYVEQSMKITDSCAISKKNTVNSDLDISVRNENFVQEPKINQKNFMKQSKLEFQKMMPESMNYSRKNRYRNENSEYNSKVRMKNFCFNDEVPEYCQYEVTRDDIKRHIEKTSKVPNTVKGKVKDWLRKMDEYLNSPLDEVAVNHANDTKNSAVLDDENPIVTAATNSEMLPQEVQNQSHQNFTYDNCSDHSVEPELKYPETNVMGTDYIIDESTLCQNNVDICNNHIEITAAAAAEKNSDQVYSVINNLNIEPEYGASSCLVSAQIDTSNIYISDEESNVILDNAVADSHINLEQGFNIPHEESVLETEDFVKYKINNNNNRIEKDILRTSNEAAFKSARAVSNTWRLAGRSVIQIDGLPVNCVLSNVEEMISSFGTVSDCEKVVFDDRLSIRFKLHDEDACDFAVQCLHDTDCLFPDSNSVLECFKVN